MVGRRWILASIAALATGVATYTQDGNPMTWLGLREPWDPKRAAKVAHEETNSVRREHDVRPLSWDPDIAEVAQDYADRMANEGFYGHDGPDGSTPRSRMEAAGCYGGENIASRDDPTISSPSEAGKAIVQQWVYSTEHVQNLLSKQHTRQGIGMAKRDGEILAVQNFC